MRTAIINGRILLPTRIVKGGVLIIEDDVIADILPEDAFSGFEGQIIDAKGRYVSPGFVDIHTHGAGGSDYMDGDLDAIIRAAKTHMQYGATSILPTTLTSSKEELFCLFDQFRQAKKSMQNGPNLLGLHLEGPYFSYLQRGAQDPRYLKKPQKENYMRILELGDGIIKRWSIAPELEGALEMGRLLRNNGVVCSAGHTDATYEQMVQAAENGFTHITHLYSGMSTIVRKGGFRYAGALEAGFLIDSMSVEIIADGKHLPESLLRYVCKFKPRDQICLVTDSMRASGMPEGEYLLGSLRNGTPTIVEDGVAKMPDRSGFAGSVATANQLVRSMLQCTDLSIVEAVRMLTENPARVMNIADKKGSLNIGRDADVILFNDDISVSLVMISGRTTVEQEYKAFI